MLKRLVTISVPLALIFCVAKIGQKISYVERQKEYARERQNPNVNALRVFSDSTATHPRLPVREELAKLQILTKLNGPNAFSITQDSYDYYSKLPAVDATLFMSYYRRLLLSDSNRKGGIEIRLEAENLTLTTPEEFDSWVSINFPLLEDENIYPVAP